LIEEEDPIVVQRPRKIKKFLISKFVTISESQEDLWIFLILREREREEDVFGIRM
jgi:F0F1-type ATP synthase beta subunit